MIEYVPEQQVNQPDQICEVCGKDYDLCSCSCECCGGGLVVLKTRPSTSKIEHGWYIPCPDCNVSGDING